MTQATIQGEVHGSQGDQQRLLDHDLEKYDQLFIEGRADIRVREVSTRFAVFLIGVILIFWVERLIAGLARVYTWVFSKGIIDINQAASEAGVPIDDEIDSGLDEIYNEFQNGKSAYIMLAVMLVLPFVSVVMLRRLILFDLNRGTWTSLANLAVIVIHILSFVFITGALFFAGGIVLRSSNAAKREQTMADAIVDSCSSNGYDQVLISCGDKHVPDIAQELRDEGWTVDPHRSGHWIARFTRYLRS